MIKANFGIMNTPFIRNTNTLLSMQQEILNIVKIHAQHGGFSVIIGSPGVGKSVLREHIEQLGKNRESVVISISRTMHTYLNILYQLADAFKIEACRKTLEKDLIQEAFKEVKSNKTLYILIDEAHLLEMTVLRKLRLLLAQFPKKHNLVLFGQRDLLHYLSMTVNADIKSRIMYSEVIQALNDDDLEQYIVKQLESVGLGINVFDSSALEIIIRTAQGNLRLCANLCYNSLVQACRDNTRNVSSRHVNNVLIQPHWRTHDELITQQVA